MPSAISYPKIWKAFVQIAQDLALQPVLVQTTHMTDSIHHHHADYNEARGIASTNLVETVGMEQIQTDVCEEKMMDQN